MIPTPSIEVQTTLWDRPSVPAWFAEVVILSQYLTTKGLLEAFAQHVRLVRGRFGSYEAPDFLAVLIGYALSGERTLADFFERLAPFGAAFMARFGRADLPHCARFLASVDRPYLEAFRTLFEQHSFAEGWTNESIGGIWNRQGQRSIVFNVGATRHAPRPRALPCDPTLPPPSTPTQCGLCTRLQRTKTKGGCPHPHRRSSDAYPSMDRHRIKAAAMVTYQGELASALQAITTYLRFFALPAQVALVRLDGQYGDAVAIAQLLEAGMHLVTRARGYRVLEHPQIQRVLAHPPTTCITQVSTNEAVEIFDSGWLSLNEGMPPVRVIVGRHRAPGSGKRVSAGKCIGEWVYEIFITTLSGEGFLAEDVLDLYHGRGAFEAVLADEDAEEDPDRWCSYTECGQGLWQIACQWVWNLRLSLGKTLQKGELREMEWVHLKKLHSRSKPWKTRLGSMAPGGGLRLSEAQRDVSALQPFPCKTMGCSVAQQEQASG